MAANDTLVPSPSDLLMVVPRLARKMASLAAALLPDQVESVMAELQNQGSVIADATSSAVENATAALAQQSTASEAAAAAAAAATESASASQTGFLSWFTVPFSPNGINGFGGIFAYIGSRWALSTFAISIFLNRTQFYASSRQNLIIRWHTRLLLYSAPTFLLLLHIFWILQTIKCQTSPLYPQLRYRDPGKRLAINFGGDGGALYDVASKLLFWKDDADCCQAMNMSLIDGDKLHVLGSFSLLWPLFLTLCFSQFTETLYCALQGRQPLPETGMTTFEHSLAFAECEAMITNAVGLGFLSSSRSASNPQPNSSESSASPAVYLTKSMILRRLNVPSEVLLIALISCLSHLSSSLLVITGRRNQLRLVNTAIWAFCYMGAFCWSFYETLNSPIDPDDLGILRFPTVCIIGFIPHMLVLVGILVCSLIYGLALLVTALSLPATAPSDPSLKERFSLAFHNMQANVQFSSASPIRMNWHEDFYTVLLKIGFNVLTAASEAVYLNEGSRIQIHSMTWLEEERLKDLAATAEHRRRFDLVPAELLEERIAKGLSFVDHQTVPSRSGFATERKSKSANDTANGRVANSDSGLGIAERRGRWQLSFDFVKGMALLLARISSRLVLSILSACGIERSPAWLGRAADYRRSTVATTTSREMHRARTPDFWLVSDNGVLSLPENGNIDVEVEMRRRLRAQRSGSDPAEDAIEEDLYGWWKRGGWWGDLDTSGDFEAHNEDDDTTSMISMSTNATSEAGSDDGDNGRRTPTQDDYTVDRDEETSEPGFGMSDLARLLDPKTAADKEEAQMLSRHLQSERPMTRAQYRRRADREKARILDIPHIEPAFGERREGAMTKAEEAEALERFLLERRAAAQHGRSGQTGSWDSGADGMGSSGPQCVVCQCSPRVIVAWPCGCLCVCDECRIGVATRNFTKCMCCRTKVVAYSRLHTGSVFTHPQALPQNSFMHSQPPTPDHHAYVEPRSPAQAASNTHHGRDQELAMSSPGSPPSPEAEDWRAEMRRLSPPLPASRNRVAEYENASATSTPRKRPDGPVFEVIKKPRKPGDKHSPIAQLPNEILTHALAHLSPADLSSVSLVSRRFHDLVTTPHAWRTAFSRYFPGPDSLSAHLYDDEEDVEGDSLRTERRAFARVTALASWRSEYILRTRLLRSLARGKPVQALAPPSSARLGQNHDATPIVTYPSQMFTTVNHLHATFGGNGLNKRPPRFVHGADDVGTASSSDPTTGKTDSWGLGDPTTFLQFSDRFPGDAQYGLGPGDIVGVPNSMDVSQPCGMVHGEGSPDGQVYFRFAEEMRGHLLPRSSGLSVPDSGVPQLFSMQEAICSVWIAKSSSIPSLTDGLVGLLSGSSLGVLNAYSLGPLGPREQRFTRGELTARWVLSPGVPIVAIAVDDQYSAKRLAQNRVWAVALNALGEVFYLTKLPKRKTPEKPVNLDDEARECLAWSTGRSVYWTLAEPSRRVARPNPYNDSYVDGSYSPRSSWDAMYLSKEQIRAETREIEDYLGRKPKDFQLSCLGWDMRRRLEVDFAGDDGNNAGEAVFVFDCGLEEDSTASAKRYVRFKVPETGEAAGTPGTSPFLPAVSIGASLFGGPASVVPSPQLDPRNLSLSLTQDEVEGKSPSRTTEEWRSSELSFGGLRSLEITAQGLDHSTFATLTISEDPLLSLSGHSTTSSPSLTPLSQSSVAATPADVPGQRARFVAVGTKMGSVVVWDTRASLPSSAEMVNQIEPVRIIHTDSPQISCLGLSSLYLVHGGNDGLVQAWDVLASSTSPIRTLNSRFSSRARRRLVQAQASPQGVGINLFAAGAVCLDSDATVLRGMVSIGTHLRYWSFSSSAADQYKSHKRRLRRSDRGSNAGNERFANVGRGNVKDFIANEQMELERDAAQRAKEAAHLAGRFGTELLGDDASEEEILAYARLLSEEALMQERQKREEEKSRDGQGLDVQGAVADIAGHEEELDADVAEAIRLSLAEEEGRRVQAEEEERVEYEMAIRFGKGRKQALSRQEYEEDAAAEGGNSSSSSRELSDLEFAMQLSLAEEQSRLDAEAAAADEFPALAVRTNGKGTGKGKGKAV